MTINIKTNFAEDYQEFSNRLMLNMGFKEKKDGYSSLDYHKTKKKWISVKPREIIYSKEYKCPEECKLGMDKFAKAVNRGDDLRPYMSKGILDVDRNDNLLSGWNIYHFHLGEKIENKSGFIKRSDWLVFAFVTDNTLYVINIYHHKEKHLWGKDELIKIIERNWVFLIEAYKLKGFVNLTQNIDDESRTLLRAKNVNIIAEPGDNKIYGMIGGGYATDGTPVEAMMEDFYWRKRVGEVEKSIHARADSFRKHMVKLVSDSLYKVLDIDLIAIWKDELILLEKERNIVIKINYINHNVRMCRLEDLHVDFINRYVDDSYLYFTSKVLGSFMNR